MSIVLFLNLSDFEAVVVEQQSVLAVQAISEVVSMQDSLELSEQLERVLD